MSEKQKIDAAVDAFAAEMKERLHSKRRQGFTGWDQLVPDIERRLLTNAAKAAIDHDKQSCVDAANLAMMIWHFEQQAAADAGKVKP